MLVGGIVGIQVEAGKERDSARERVSQPSSNIHAVMDRTLTLCTPVSSVQDAIGTSACQPTQHQLPIGMAHPCSILAVAAQQGIRY